MDTIRICSIEGCGKKLVAKGYCHLHWNRSRKGLPMIPGRLRAQWGAPEALKMLSLETDTDECLIWPYHRDRNGYAVHTDTTTVGSDYVSRQICEIKHGPPPHKSSQAAHKCGNGAGGCYNWKHLRWASPSQNSYDKMDHGTVPLGSNHPNAKMTEDKVLEARARWKNGETVTELAKELGVHKASMHDIVHRINWAWL